MTNPPIDRLLAMLTQKPDATASTRRSNDAGWAERMLSAAARAGRALNEWDTRVGRDLAARMPAGTQLQMGELPAYVGGPKAAEQSMKLFHGGRRVLSESDLAAAPMYLSPERSFAESYSTGRHGMKVPQVSEFEVSPDVKLADRSVFGPLLQRLDADQSISEADALGRPSAIKALRDMGYGGAKDAWDFGFRDDFEELPVTVVFDALHALRKPK